eukprot:TRINITY_DN411_c0_g1_i2.p1 TRINITY_DN411_c0_g1~~TRINITY_DN411_c0_g1_i2.p1  ORF type:complete len:447 (-),score=260.76 TRINITY_DN411_c0_g1_i2:77-1417(-)
MDYLKREITSPIPDDLKTECKKVFKILTNFLVPDRDYGPDKIIPRDIIEKAQGIAVLTVFKAGFLLSARGGSGLVVARLDDSRWSAPSAIGSGGIGGGFQIGAELADFVIVLNTKDAVRAFMHGGNLTLGGNLSIAAGPVGRNAEASGTAQNIAAIYSYSRTRGLFAGVSLEGSVVIERQDANKHFYKKPVRAREILSGLVDPPGEAYKLYQILNLRSHDNNNNHNLTSSSHSSSHSSHSTPSHSSHSTSSHSHSTPSHPAHPSAPHAHSVNAPPPANAGYNRNAPSVYGQPPPGPVYGQPGVPPPGYSQGPMYGQPSPGPMYGQPPGYPQGSMYGQPPPGPMYGQPPGPMYGQPPGPVGQPAGGFGQPPPAIPKASHRAPPPVPAQSKPTVKQATSLFVFDAADHTELSFKPGDVLIIHSQFGDWWEAELNGRRGLIPANYVKML